ncbi:unnamed protein product [Allacma fusca]|uniref:Uncharacterized protein n=1 Tax=Allacma fusca TaxID=39272 RepID=A0A8J2JKL0_9HEXA|nr:unnamed protein product [Allacma fusca]
MESVLENKGAPGNGLTDTVSPEEVEPLKSKKKINAYREEMMDIGPDGDEDRHSKGSDPGFLERWAYKCQLSPKRGLLYLIVAFIIILLLFIILICLAAAWPHHLNRNTCSTPQCHLFSAKVRIPLLVLKCLSTF